MQMIAFLSFIAAGYTRVTRVFTGLQSIALMLKYASPQDI
jgi:hypothetical protein